MVDGLYLREMAAKIRRGLRGQLERGFATGSITYGYRTVPVPDPSGKTDVNGYPVLVGKRVEIIPQEARVVRQIFELFASGLGATSIVDRLNRDGVPGPRGATWKRGALKWILDNERYTGKLIWGRVRFERRPGTRQKIARPVPREQWHTQDRPDLRIIDPALWDRVQARRHEVRNALPPASPGTPRLMRGRNAALYSKNLFSGFMRCAACGGAITAVNSGNGSPRYGCSRSHRNGLTACPNRLTIRAKVADPLLLTGLRAELVNPATIRYVIDTLTAALNQVIDERPQRETETRAAREQAVQRLQRLVDAIEQGVSPVTLAAAIAEREAEIARLDAQLTPLGGSLHRRLAVIPAWVTHQLRDLAGLLNGTPERVKTEFRRLGLAVVLHPVHDEGQQFYRAIGQAALPCLAGKFDLKMSTVDRLPPRRGPQRARLPPAPRRAVALGPRA
jgi:hypothetical protein